jgi:hypothetical protein
MHHVRRQTNSAVTKVIREAVRQLFRVLMVLR